MNNFALPLRYGLIGGFVMCITGLVSWIFYNQLFGTLTVQMLYGFATLAIMIFIPIWGTVTFKREKGKVTFSQAFTAGMIIIVIMLVFSSIMNYLIPNVIDKEYPEKLYEKVKSTTADLMEKFGAPDEQIDKALERIRLEDFQPTLLRTFRSFGIGVGLGALLCLIVAAFVSRPERQQPPLATDS